MRMHNADETCGIARAAVVLGDWWNVLILREIARGHVRFDALAAGIGLSRNVLTERLGLLRRERGAAPQPLSAAAGAL